MLFIPNQEVTKHETDLVEEECLGNGKISYRGCENTWC